MAINPRIKQKAEDIRKKIFGTEVRESLASGIEAISEDVEATIGRQGYVEDQFQDVLDETTGKDVISAPELIAARNGKSNLKTRLDDEHAQVTAQLQQTVQLANVKAFGAQGDGIADDTQAIKNAIKGVKQHGKLYFPAGLYRITDTIANINALGKHFAFDWEGEATGSFIVVDLIDPAKNAVEINKVNEIQVKNLTLIGKQDCAKNGIFTDRAMRSDFENITILAGVSEYAFYTIHGYCNRYNIKTPNSLTTGTVMSDVIASKWAHPANGIFMTGAFASTFDVVLEGYAGNGIVSDNSLGDNQSITIKGTIENLGGRALDLKNITVLVIDNLYEEANNKVEFGGYIGMPTSIFEDCHFIDITGHRGHYGAYKFLNCSNVDSGSPQFMQDVAGNNGYSNDSPRSFNSSIEIESNTTGGIDPVRNNKASLSFLNYPYFDRISASNRLVDSVKYPNNGLVTDHSDIADHPKGTPNALALPQTNNSHYRLDVSRQTAGLGGRMVYATLLIKKPVTTLGNPYYTLAFVTKAGNASAKNVYIDDLEDGWNRITLATKLSAAAEEMPSYFRITGQPLATDGDSSLFLPLEISYLAITVDKPSVSPFDFNGTLIDGTRFENGTKITYDSKPPTLTTYHAVKGDRVLNKNANSGEYQGYLCVTSSSPGVWKGYGLVEGGPEVPKVKKVETISLDSQTVVSGTTIDIDTGVSVSSTENAVVTFRHKTSAIPSGIVLSDWIPSNGNVYIRLSNISESDKLIENVDVRILVIYS